MSSLAVSALPRCVALRSKLDNKSYLRSVHDESHGGSLVELRGGDGGLMNPRARFYLESSREHEGLVHVRCCYNNKYWVPQQRMLPDGSARWVIGTAHEPEEDLSKPSCTLHRFISVAGEQAEEDGSTTCRFLHSKLGKYTCSTMSSTSSIRSYMHIAAHEDKADRQDGGDGGLIIDAFTVIDVSDQKQLPKYVAFKGDNDLFLAGVVQRKLHWLQFSGEDIGNQSVLHTTCTNDDGVVRIKSNHFDRFWRNSTNWIWADSDDNTHNNPDTLFTVTTGDDFVALRNLGNNRFCMNLTDYWKNCLNAAVDSITKKARLQCYEPVISRKIYNVDFRLGEAKMYTTGIDGLTTQTVRNRTSIPVTQSLTLEWKKKVESTWSNTVSMKISIGNHINTGVPFFAGGKIDISTEFSDSYTWGKTISEEDTITRSVTVNVDPMKKVTVKAIGSNGLCDIPFSYTQKDVLLNGQEVIQEFTDGIYKGVKTSDVTLDITEEDLSDDEV